MSDMIVKQSYWDDAYSKYAFSRVHDSDPTRQLIKKIVPLATNNQTAFEFGCFPGRYLLELGKLGYTVSGCDQTPRVEIELSDWMSDNQVAIGQFYRCNFRDTPKNKYDVVSSFGFIEHFKDYPDVFHLHFDLVKPGGLVLVQFPNFRGSVQHTLHRLFDRDNLRNHVIDSMNLKYYQDIAKSYGTVLFCDFYGGFDFWIDDFKGRNGWLRARALKIFQRTSKVWPQIPTSPTWAPYAAILVRTPQ
ncbi:bifunctional 2-polyprenyl-6-hydroxyphenol methylase/3-demethylubiquinol 3-O-methyltransferase UbiG [Limnohabitans sp. 2KL-3]|uniref:class I SAM-dependent methyltransferase n=1 Tax=Limnohabitans sp. 2KL-3 TaxID=1100700 RepID=UPI000B13C542|nr:class I SAM-dependent methyltransferase [Limnohabitans sp. 2KL-3]